MANLPPRQPAPWDNPAFDRSSAQPFDGPGVPLPPPPPPTAQGFPPPPSTPPAHGFPPPPPAAPPAAPAQSAQPRDFESSVDPDEEFDATVVITRARSTTDWKLIDIDGTMFPLAPRNVLGRKPTAGPDDAQYIALSDPDRVLSRTHLLIEVEGDQLWITDLKSTNGTEIVSSDAAGAGAGDRDEIQPCEALSRYALTADQGLSLGGRSITFQPPESV